MELFLREKGQPTKKFKAINRENRDAKIEF